MCRHICIVRRSNDVRRRACVTDQHMRVWATNCCGARADDGPLNEKVYDREYIIV